MVVILIYVLSVYAIVIMIYYLYTGRYEPCNG